MKLYKRNFRSLTEPLRACALTRFVLTLLHMHPLNATSCLINVWGTSDRPQCITTVGSLLPHDKRQDHSAHAVFCVGPTVSFYARSLSPGRGGQWASTAQTDFSKIWPGGNGCVRKTRESWRDTKMVIGWKSHFIRRRGISNLLKLCLFFDTIVTPTGL